MPLRITGAADAALIDLPWSVPLSAWPEDRIAALPRGLSRHVVRFVRHGEAVLAVKETNPHLAHKEFEMLRQLDRLGAPCVKAVAVVTERVDHAGDALPAALVTEHLAFSLPYRALFSQGLRKGTLKRLIDALSVLLVRLHLNGFYWGDVSLSNALFRRDAAEFSAYLVDAETADMHHTLTDGQRGYDLEIAITNIAGELLDLQASEDLDESVDPFEIADRISQRYEQLWLALTETETLTSNIPLHVSERVKALNSMGFDVGEIDMQKTDDGTALTIRPKVVDAGHHSRRLLRLTGLDVQENQARRLLNDLDEFRTLHIDVGDDETFGAHQWLTRNFEPTVRAVPRNLRGKLEPAQLFHEVLDHRWYLAQSAGHDVPMPVATASYVKNILPTKEDEKAVLGRSLAEMTAELPALTAEVGSTYAVRDAYENDNTHGWGTVPEPDESTPPVVRRATTRVPVTAKPQVRRAPDADEMDE
jgi:tRNA A-37 threonylcarbamoyl transferase component Bud32